MALKLNFLYWGVRGGTQKVQQENIGQATLDQKKILQTSFYFFLSEYLILLYKQKKRGIYRKCLWYLVTPLLSLLTSKYQFTDIISQKDIINVTNGTNVHLLVVSLISFCFLRAKKPSIYKKQIWCFFTHIHRYFTSKYQITEII